MPSMKLEVDFEVWCENCGKGICHLVTTKGQKVYVEPCPTCLEEKRQGGYDDGYADGKEDGSNG